MIRYILIIAFGVIFELMVYWVGYTHAQNDIATSQQETCTHVRIAKNKIYARPNAGRTALLRLMFDNRL